MEKLVNLIEQNQSLLCKKILSYAKLYGYVKYTSTLEEAWVASIRGLSDALISATRKNPNVPEIDVDLDLDDEIYTFGNIEAKKHRERGISLKMFLSLMKYYRQSYIDLIDEYIIEKDQLEFYKLWVNRFFDHTEISYCAEWTSTTEDTKLLELQSTNRKLTNEKNKYITIFESMPTPAIILDTKNNCTNINYAAQQLLQNKEETPGKAYYSNISSKPSIEDGLPWLYDDFILFNKSDKLEYEVEKEYLFPLLGKRNLLIKFHRMLDVSDKFAGTVILLNDLTDSKNLEEQLRILSFHDILTGLYNRTFMAEEILRLSSGDYNPVGFISIDIDGLKLVNDNLGHIAGDKLLITVSQILKDSFDDKDIIVRTGGDEFSIIKHFSNEKSVKESCENLRKTLNEHNTKYPKLPVSISIGWSVENLGEEEIINQAMKDADYKMYKDKNNRHEMYTNFFFQSFEKYGLDLFK